MDVLRVRGDPEAPVSDVLLLLRHQVITDLRGKSKAYRKNPLRFRIERSRVPQLFHAEHAAEHRDHIEGGISPFLVDNDNSVHSVTFRVNGYSRTQV